MKKFFPNTWSKPSLIQLETSFSCPITCSLGKKTDLHLSVTFFQAVVDTIGLVDLGQREILSSWWAGSRPDCWSWVSFSLPCLQNPERARAAMPGQVTAIAWPAAWGDLSPNVLSWRQGMHTTLNPCRIVILLWEQVKVLRSYPELGTCQELPGVWEALCLPRRRYRHGRGAGPLRWLTPTHRRPQASSSTALFAPCLLLLVAGSHTAGWGRHLSHSSLLTMSPTWLELVLFKCLEILCGWPSPVQMWVPLMSLMRDRWFPCAMAVLATVRAWHCQLAVLVQEPSTLDSSGWKLPGGGITCYFFFPSPSSLSP